MIPDRPSFPNRTKFRQVATAVATLAGIFCFALAWSPKWTKSTSTAAMQLKAAADFDSSSLRFEASNEYTIRDGRPGQHLEWLDNALLAEPYRDTTLSVLNPDSSSEYRWSILHSSGGDEAPDAQQMANELEASYVGPSWSYVFTDAGGVRTVVLQEYIGGLLSSTVSKTLHIRYVRREIRNLLTRERDEFLDVLALHWQVEQAEGEQLYGSRYRSALTLLEYHLEGAGDKTCDHLHDGYGVFAQHAAITILLEQSIQEVNPKLSMPYWDYVQDFEEFQAAGQGFMGFVNGELFSSEYFGATDADGHVQDGRWARLTIPTVADIAAADPEGALLPHNAHGFLRAPWSNNRDPLALRSATLCGEDASAFEYVANCESLEEVTQLGGFQDWLLQSSFRPHGSVHILLGGLLNCAEGWQKAAAAGVPEEPDLKMMRAWNYAYYKNAFRMDLMACDDTDVDGCYCPEYDAMMSDITKADDFLNRLGLARWCTDCDEAQRTAVVDAFCTNGAVAGEASQASSSFMPEFWPIHGTLERLFQLRRLRGGWDDDWDWSAETFSGHYDSCFGHGRNDPILLGKDAFLVRARPFHLGAGGADRQPSDFTVENFHALLDPLDPASQRLDYIYDNVDWTYCRDSYGYDDLVVHRRKGGELRADATK